ncbi:hypothetical protein AK829_00880 [Corynebacterium riegelii]|uniref:IstB-like ATP-binding domain-containing protein n=1 Tax=Corynebacterium riegelii TaxID=156976 RepID=A0A0K1REA6_9CORY|nr:hypothetical protein AK829_00880 [Corynebacterium riegelii]
MLAVFSPTDADQNYLDTMRKLINVDVFIIDDFMTMSINQRGQEDLSKIIFDRDGRLPTLISSRSAAAYWVEELPDRVGADSLVSRLNNGRRNGLLPKPNWTTYIRSDTTSTCARPPRQ